jgi:hypothetical protein
MCDKEKLVAADGKRCVTSVWNREFETKRRGIVLSLIGTIEVIRQMGIVLDL